MNEQFVYLDGTEQLFQAVRIDGEWNSFAVPVFTYGEAWHILTVLDYEFGDNYEAHIWYTDTVTGEQVHLHTTEDGNYIFTGWMWHVAEIVSVQTVDVCVGLMTSNLEMEFVTGAIMDTLEEWVSPLAGKCANENGRDILNEYATLILSTLEEWGDASVEYPRAYAYLNSVVAR